LSRNDEQLEFEPLLPDTKALYRWFHRQLRQSAQHDFRQFQARQTLNDRKRTNMEAGNLGYPRIGIHRELKKSVERFWSGEASEAALRDEAARIRKAAWSLQQDLGCDLIPSNDFSFYDQVLDTTAMLGAVPDRFEWRGDQVDLPTYFAMARGRVGVSAMEMTKWFDTNYHYIVPELNSDQKFRLASTKAVDEFVEGKNLGIATRPVVIGPVTYLLLAKMTDTQENALSLLDAVLPVYEELLRRLVSAGAVSVQIDEPILVTDLPVGAAEALRKAYAHFARALPKLPLMLTTYFGDLRDNLELAVSLPVAGWHVDLTRGRDQLDAVLAKLPKDKWLSLGVVDGRNIWRTNLDEALRSLQTAAKVRGGERLIVAPSCSLLHVPHDLDLETKLDVELKGWLAFAKQKLAEIKILAKAINNGPESVAEALTTSRAAFGTRATSPRVRREAVQARTKAADPKLAKRQSPFSIRQQRQRRALGLPLFPTTTIGSFPQTSEIRKARADHKAGRLSDAEYQDFLKKEIALVVKSQEELDIDVLVHGEPERNDMVEYFGEQLAGFAFTQQGWVQSYGSRCVKPPLIYGDVARPRPMTVEWSRYAQSLTKRPMKGMLTGPVTILQWSFVRDDQPHSETCRQIAFALRDEVVDLERAGIRIIQIDEPALREGLPLRRADWDAYLQWAGESFRIAASGVKDETQIHTHMCYAEFNDIMPAIAALDADVISLESSRSRMELLTAFRDEKYPNEIGPGVYDIHSPRVPTTSEIVSLLNAATESLVPEQLWVNPDCGLKTRGWPEVRESLRNMVSAARQLRQAKAGV
jgi:5-methyltetrahydropteroyltriglutamate--homocysteine methyltransferase